MSIANDNPELTQRSGEVGDDLIIPLRSLGKAEIENITRDWLIQRLAVYPTEEMYVFLKQMEQSVKSAIEILKERAFNATGDKFRGEKSGEILGHNVKLTYPSRWIYSPAVKELEAQQKLDVDALKAQERAGGLAIKEDGKGIITVTIKS